MALVKSRPKPNVKNDVTLGILGGMGPRATVEFEQRLLDSFFGTDQVLPRIICINDGSIPDRSAFLEGKGENPAPSIIRNALLLERAGVNFICIPCNTAHAQQIMEGVLTNLKVPLISMPQACIDQAERLGLKSILVMGTMGTCHSGVFERNPSIVCIYPGVECQDSINNLISAVKTGNTPRKLDIDRVKQEINIKEAGAVVLACTELSMIKQQLVTNKTTIDSIDELVKSCRAELT